jgi:hypothetical protein
MSARKNPISKDYPTEFLAAGTTSSALAGFSEKLQKDIGIKKIHPPPFSNWRFYAAAQRMCVRLSCLLARLSSPI